jgi:hypothetical protein
VDIQNRIPAEELTRRVIPGRLEEPNPESRDSGFVLRTPRNDDTPPLAKMSALCRRLRRCTALFAPWHALTIAGAGHWNQCRFPGILGAGDGEPALF